MPWTTFNSIAIDPCFDKQLTKRIESVNKEREKLVADQDAHDNRARDLLERDPAGIEPSQLAGEVFMAEGNKSERLELLGRELQLRKTLAELLPSIGDSLNAARSKASKDQEQIRVELCEALVKLGYEPFPPGGVTGHFQIQPVFWMRNHRWHNAKELEKSFLSRSNDVPNLRNANEAAITAIVNEIQAMRRKAVAA
jgi:hypothetical protein